MLVYPGYRDAPDEVRLFSSFGNTNCNIRAAAQTF